MKRFVGYNKYCTAITDTLVIMQGKAVVKVAHNSCNKGRIQLQFLGWGWSSLASVPLFGLRLRAGVKAFPRCSKVAGWLSRRAGSLGERRIGVVAAILISTSHPKKNFALCGTQFM